MPRACALKTTGEVHANICELLFCMPELAVDVHMQAYAECNLCINAQYHTCVMLHVNGAVTDLTKPVAIVLLGSEGVIGMLCSMEHSNS
jgi:hypothetical protein